MPTRFKDIRKKGASPNALHHLINTATLPAFLWGSEIWCTGAAHVVCQAGPTYNSITRYITALPNWTPIKLPLREAGFPPLTALQDPGGRCYSIRILLATDNHPCKLTQLWYLAAPLWNATAAACGK